jgi:hypothetical protein
MRRQAGSGLNGPNLGLNVLSLPQRSSASPGVGDRLHHPFAKNEQGHMTGPSKQMLRQALTMSQEKKRPVRADLLNVPDVAERQRLDQVLIVVTTVVVERANRINRLFRPMAFVRSANSHSALITQNSGGREPCRFASNIRRSSETRSPLQPST